MARPKGTGGRSRYDKYRKFTRRKRTTRRTSRGMFSTGRSNTKYDKSHFAKKRKSRFSK